MTVQAFPNPGDQDLLMGAALLGVIGVALLAVLPTKRLREAPSSAGQRNGQFVLPRQNRSERIHAEFIRNRSDSPSRRKAFQRPARVGPYGLHLGRVGVDGSGQTRCLRRAWRDEAERK